MAKINNYLNGAVTFPLVILPTGKQPLDGRLIVNKKSELNINNFKTDSGDEFWYLGMVVSCLEDSKLYILKEINSVPTFCEITAESDIKGVDSNDKILSLNGGLISSTLAVDVRKLTADEEGYDANNPNKEYIILKGKDNTIISKVDASRFVVDGMIESVVMGEDNVLTITWNTDVGSNQTKIDFGKYIDIHPDARNGVQKVTENGQTYFEGVVDSSSENYLTVGTDGFKIAGIDQAITNAVSPVDAKADVNAEAIIDIYNRLNWSDGSFEE